MQKFNLVKSLTRIINNITSLPFKEGLGLGRLFILCLAIATFGVESAWGLDQYVIVTDFDSSTTFSGKDLDNISGGNFSKTSNHVMFNISGVSYKDPLGVRYLTYGDISANSSKTSSFTWNADNNYFVKITEVSIDLRGYQAKISIKTAKAQFSDGTTSGTLVDCKTNSTGNGGTKEVKINNTNGIISPLTLTMSTGENKAEYTIPEVRYTYKVTHKEYLFGFSADAIKNIDGGTVSTSVQNATIQAAIGITSASTTATYSVTSVSAGFGFVGWYSDSNCSNLVSTETSCQQTINNSTAGSIANKTLYAKFAPLPYFYFKAQAGNVGTGNVYASFSDGSFSATSDIKTERATTLAQTQSTDTYTAYFKAEETNAAYHFAGWYTDAECTDANRVSTNLIYSEQISGSTATTEASAKTITRYAKFVQELTPEVTANYSGSPKAMFVEDEIASAFSFLNTSTFGSGLSVVSSNNNIITYDATQNKVIAKNEGTATLTFTQTKQDIIKAGEFVFTFTVSKITNTLSADATHSMKVDETWNGVISGKNSDATVTTTTSDATIAYYDVASNTIVAQNTNNQSFNSKEVTITISQAATYKYTAAEKTIKVTVDKHVPTFTWSNATLYHNQTYNDFLTTNGTNELTIKSSDADVAYLVDGANAQKLNLKTLSKVASTILTVTQAENYYWAEHTESKIITPEYASNHVPFTINQSLYNTLRGGSSGDQSWEDNSVKVGSSSATIEAAKFNDKYIILGPFVGIPDKLSLSYSCSLASTGWDYRVYESSNGSNWSQLFKDEERSGSKSNIQLSPETRYIQLFWSGNYAGYFKDITITELKTFSTSTNEIDFGNNRKDIACASQTFTFNYANVGHKVVLETSDPHFSVSPTSITNIGGEQCGTQTITVSYRTDEVHSATNAKLTIKDELGNSKEITLTGNTTKKTQTISWASPYDIAEPAIPIGKTITGAATASSQLGVIYESSDPSVIAIVENGTAFKALAAGSATITVKQLGTEDWEAASISKTFKGTNKIIQVISWNQNFTRLLTDYGPQSLTAIVNLENAETGVQTYSKERSDLITYTSQNTSIVSVNGSTLTIVGKGETTLTASVQGDDLYESATVTIPVKVREPSAGCEDVLLGNDFGSDEYEFFHYSLTSDMEKVVTIDRTTPAIPGVLSFQHKGKKWGLNYSGEIVVYESTDNGSNWTTLGSITPSEGTYNPQTYNLSRDATHIKFFRGKSATGYHYIKDVEISPSQFIESDISGNKIDFGVISVNSVETKDFSLKYANVKDNLSINKTSADLSLSCGEIIDLDCGTTGITPIIITFNPEVVGDFSDDIQFLDKNSGKNYTLKITAKVEKSTQHITWNPSKTEYRTIDQIELNATASSNNPVQYYVKEGNDVANFVNGVLTIKKDGQVTIRAHEPGDALWATAVDVDKTFTIRKTNLHFDPLPTAATITYPQVLSESSLTNGVVKDEDGNVVAGTITWTNPTTQLNAGENQTQGITFSPANNTAWYNPLTSTVSVTVQKAQTDARARACDIIYGATVQTSTLTNEGTTEGIWSWTDEKKDQVLPVGTHEGLQVYFTPTDQTNYDEIDGTVSITVNAPSENIFTNAARDNDWNNPNNWSAGLVPEKTDEVDIVVSGELNIEDEVVVGSLTIEDGGSVNVLQGGDLTIQSESGEIDKYGDLYVKKGGDVTLNGTLNVHDFVIESSIGTADGSSKSGQITNADKLLFNDGDAYIDIYLDPSGSADDAQWYGFTVPFEVDIATGIYRKESNGSFKQLKDKTNFDIMQYNTAKRLTTGKGWEYYHGVLHPGEFYYLAIDGTNNIYRFRKKAGAGFTTEAQVALHTNGDMTNPNANWNPVGNPCLRYTTTDYDGFVQVYKNGQSAYLTVSANEVTYVVGCPFFVQAQEEGSLMLETSDATGGQFYAPHRMATNNAKNQIQLLTNQGKVEDQIFITVSEDASLDYEAGSDLLKAGVSKLCGQMWLNAYGQQLSVQDAPLQRDEATYYMSLYAPKAGDYMLHVNSSDDSGEIYLTLNNMIIWNLSDGNYPLSLSKGTTEEYGLVFQRTQPGVSTDIKSSKTHQLKKFIHHEQMYILHNGQLYNAIGGIVK